MVSMNRRTKRPIPAVKKPEYEGLPDDIVHNILVKLPVKTLIRFKCVSKPWYSLISDHSFQQDHYCHQSQQDPLLLLTRYDEFDKISNTTTFHLSTHNNEGTLVNKFRRLLPLYYENPLTIESCQGLVCIFDNWAADILLCNPSTREIITLPQIDCPNLKIGFGYAATEFQNIGFGYAASAKEFKVVRFFECDETDTYDVQILTLGSREWRPGRYPPQYQGPFCLGVPFLHGSLHLLPLVTDPTGVGCIYAFDIQNEEYTSIHLPEVYRHSSRTSRRLIKFGDSLCFCLYHNFETLIEIWLLKDYKNGEWVKEYTIDLASLGIGVQGAPLVRMRDGSILMNICDWSLYSNNPRESLYSYNPRDGTFKEEAEDDYSAALYVECFLSPQVICNRVS